MKLKNFWKRFFDLYEMFTRTMKPVNVVLRVVQITDNTEKKIDPNLNRFEDEATPTNTQTNGGE